MLNKRYRVAFIVNNLELVNAFKLDIDTFEENRVYDKELFASGTLGAVEDIDVVIVSSAIMNENDVITIRNRHFKSAVKVFYIAEELNIKNLRVDLLTTNNIEVLPAFLTEKQIILKVKSDLGFTVRDNVLAVYGIARYVGTTTVAQTLATIIAREGHKVCLVDLSATANMVYTNIPYKNDLSDLLGLLHKGESITDALKDKVVLNTNLNLVTGVGSILEARSYNTKDIEIIINTVKSDYDFVIIDAGAPNDYLMNIGALQCASRKLLVTAPRPQQISQFERFRSSVLDTLKLNEFFVVHNQIQSMSSQETDYVASRFNGENYNVLTTVGYSDMSIRSELEKTLIYDLDKRRRSEWDILASKTIALFGEELGTKKSSFFRR